MGQQGRTACLSFELTQAGASFPLNVVWKNKKRPFLAKERSRPSLRPQRPGGLCRERAWRRLDHVETHLGTIDQRKTPQGSVKRTLVMERGRQKLLVDGFCGAQAQSDDVWARNVLSNVTLQDSPAGRRPRRPRSGRVQGGVVTSFVVQ